MSITKRTVTEHMDALRKKEYSAKELTEAYLSEIEKSNDTIRAFVYTDKAMATDFAAKADSTLQKGNAPSLCGIPFGVKDNICQKGVPTTAASKMLSDFVPPYDATVMEKLKTCGAVSLGKTNMDEFAMGSTTETSVYGATRNPLSFDRTAGGSSGGSAAAVAGGLVPFALGSDTGGSVRQPAAFCGVVGLSPTYGSVSRYGLIAFASSLDRIGILSKNCRDCAEIFLAVSGKDPHDSTTKDFSFNVEDCTQSIKGLRIGIAEELFYGVKNEIKNAVLSAADTLLSLGCRIVPVSLPSLRYSTEAYYIISSAEASSNLGRYDGVRFGHRTKRDAGSIDDFYKMNRSEGLSDEVKRRIMLGTFALSEGSYESYYKKALSVRDLICEDYRKAFEQCDIILSPTAPCEPPPLFEKREDPTILYSRDLCTVSQSLAHLPALSVPCKRTVNGLPVGMQLTGSAFSEGLLLRVGKAYEDVIK